MDLLHLVINSEKSRHTCFLCFKQSGKTTNLHELIEIHDEYFEMNTTLWNIVKELFPAHDIFVTEACEDCSSLLIKIFILLHKSQIKYEMVNYLVTNINEELDDRVEFEEFLKVDLPTPEKLLHTKIDRNIDRNSHHCKKCSMKFKTKSLLRKHMKDSHQNTNDAVVCHICGKTFNKTAALKAHLSGHKGKQCPYCFKVLTSLSHFSIHVKNHNSPIKRQRRRLKHHSCDNCSYKSYNKNSLEAHKNKVHLNIRPFKCHICEKGFYKKSNLTQHIVIHEKVKNKTCEVCGDTFDNEKTLVEHLRIHSGEKPFKCNYCSAEFITSGRRLEHMKRNHLEKEECCIICDKRFGLKKDLNTHLKKVHGAENFILKLDSNQEVQVIKVINHSK